jgi:hypothetical protein
MARGYLRMYQDELLLLQSIPGSNPARIAQLQQWINELNMFIAKL